MSALGSVGSLGHFAFRRRMMGWKIVFNLVVALIPSLVAFIAIRAIRGGDGDLTTPYVLYGRFLAPISLYFVLPFLCMMTMLPVVSELYEKGSVGYLLTRPAPRWTVVLGLYLGGLMAMLPIMLLTAGIPGMILMPYSQGIEARFWLQRIFGLAGILWLGAASYGALCLFFAVWSRKALLWSLGMLIGWGAVAGSITGPLRTVSLHRYLLGLMRNWLDVENTWSQGFFVPDSDPPTSTLSLIVLSVATVMFIAMAVAAIRKRDVL